MDDGELDFTTRAPKPGPRVQIFRCVKSATLTATILNDTYWGLLTHWDGKANRSRPCLGKKCDCQERQIPTRFKGWVHVLRFPQNDMLFFELTPQAVEQIEKQIPRETSWRGYRIQARRSNSTTHGRLIVEVLEAKSNLENLPVGQDPEEVLRNLWNMKTRR